MYHIVLLGLLLASRLVSGAEFLGDCPGQEVLVTETLRVGHQVVNVSVPGCPGSVRSSHPIDPAESFLARRSVSSGLLRRSSLEDGVEKRSALASPTECGNAAICQCGISCSVSCETFDASAPAPTTGDCESLISILRSLHGTIGSTFVQGTGFPNPIIFDFSTCRASFGNIKTGGGQIEYCWDGLADNVASVLNSCIAPGATLGGDCTASTGQWEMAVSGYPRVG